MKHHFLHYMDQVIHNRWRDVAFVDYGEKKQYTHGEVAQQVRRFHKLFRLMGIQPGDKIAIASRNCSNWVVSYMAIMSYKAVAVTLLQDFKAEDLARLIEHSDSKMLIVGPYVWRELQNQQLPELQAIMSMDDFSFIHLAEPYKGHVEHVMSEESTLTENTFFSLVQDGEIDLDSLALINYTSGSTGSPKGVMISHRSLSNNTENGQHILPVEPGQHVVSMLPLAHMFGQLADFLYPFSAGATIYYLTKAPTPSILLKAMADVKPYLVATVPLVIEKIHKKKLDPLLSKPVLKFFWHTPGIMNIIRGHVKKSLVKAFGGQVRYFLCGGAAMNPIVEKCLMDVNFPLSIGFGMTECGPLVSGLPPKYFKRRSCGAPALSRFIQIVDCSFFDAIGRTLAGICENLDASVRILFSCNACYLCRSQFNCYNKICCCHILLLFFGTDNLVIKFYADSLVLVPSYPVQGLAIENLQPSEFFLIVFSFSQEDKMVSYPRNEFQLFFGSNVDLFNLRLPEGIGL